MIYNSGRWYFQICQILPKKSSIRHATTNYQQKQNASQKRLLNPLKLELQAAISHQVGTSYLNPVLYKNSALNSRVDKFNQGQWVSHQAWPPENRLSGLRALEGESNSCRLSSDFQTEACIPRRPSPWRVQDRIQNPMNRYNQKRIRWTKLLKAIIILLPKDKVPFLYSKRVCKPSLIYTTWKDR